MTDHFKSPRSMLGRAERQINDLEAQINSFMGKKEAWSIAAEEDPSIPEMYRQRGLTHRHVFKFTEALSEDLPHIVFEAVNNLRATLDQVGFAVATLNGVENPRSCKFPFGPTEEKMRNDANSRCKDLPADVRTLFEGFKPYKGGNNALWALNELANTPKHKLLFPVALGSHGANVDFIRMANGGMRTIRPTWDGTKNELTFLWTTATTKISYNLDVVFSVAINEVDDVINGHQPVSLLRDMAASVKNVVDETEAVCRRIGLWT